jgi:hypothetical protein
VLGEFLESFMKESRQLVAPAQAGFLNSAVGSRDNHEQAADLKTPPWRALPGF